MAKEAIYVELAKAKTQDRRNIVISECSKGGFTIAQQLEVDEGNRTTNVFLKGAFHINDIDGMYNLRDALNAAIMEYEKSVSDFGDEADGTAGESADEIPDSDWDE